MDWTKHAREQFKKGKSTTQILDKLEKIGLSNHEQIKILDKITKKKEHPKVFYAIIIIILIGSAYIFIQLKIEQTKWTSFDPSSVTDPIQISHSEYLETRDIGSNSYVINSLAKYKVTALVAHKKNYNDAAKFSPLDLLLAWGRMVEPEILKAVTYDQNGFGADQRRGYWHWNYGFPISPSYVNSHVANTHMIAANDKVLQGLNKVSRLDIVYLEGFLVEIKDTSTGRKWKSSLSRTDTGDSCELFYVTNMTLYNQSYY